MYGDGGQSGCHIWQNPAFRFNNFYLHTRTRTSRRRSGEVGVISAPFFAAGESRRSTSRDNDPVVSETIFAGLNHVWRTKTTAATGRSRDHMPEFTTPGNQPGCGDFVPLGIRPARVASHSGDLTSTLYGRQRADAPATTSLSVVRSLARQRARPGGDAPGRVFITKNAMCHTGL